MPRFSGRLHLACPPPRLANVSRDEYLRKGRRLLKDEFARVPFLPPSPPPSPSSSPPTLSLFLFLVAEPFSSALQYPVSHSWLKTHRVRIAASAGQDRESPATAYKWLRWVLRMDGGTAIFKYTKSGRATLSAGQTLDSRIVTYDTSNVIKEPRCVR